MDLEEIGINTKNWVDSTQDRDYWRALVNAALNLRVPYSMELVIVQILLPSDSQRMEKNLKYHPTEGKLLILVI